MLHSLKLLIELKKFLVSLYIRNENLLSNIKVIQYKISFYSKDIVLWSDILIFIHAMLHLKTNICILAHTEKIAYLRYTLWAKASNEHSCREFSEFENELDNLN